MSGQERDSAFDARRLRQDENGGPVRFSSDLNSGFLTEVLDSERVLLVDLEDGPALVVT
jgi:hypothetical protein